MKSTERSLSALFKREILQLAVAVVFSGIILTLGYLYVEGIESQKTNALNQQRQLNSEIDRVIDDDNIINEIGETFIKLKAKGFYALEERLAWTEVLQQVSDQLKLPNFKYSISPQKTISNIGSGFQSNLGLSESMITIDADLLHEGDFATVTQQLATFAPGTFTVHECTMERDGVIATNQIKRNVGLKCSLALYTIKPSQQDKVVQ